MAGGASSREAKTGELRAPHASLVVDSCMLVGSGSAADESEGGPIRFAVRWIFYGIERLHGKEYQYLSGRLKHMNIWFQSNAVETSS